MRNGPKRRAAVLRQVAAAVVLPILPALCIGAATAPPDGRLAARKSPAARVGAGRVRPSSARARSDNPLGGCGLCHVDVEDKVKGTRHLKEEVGCVKCHGKSLGHVADENNDVKPDHMIVRKEVDSFCGECHPCERPPAAKPSRKPGKERKVCTDCHGAHKIAVPGKKK